MTRAVQHWRTDEPQTLRRQLDEQSADMERRLRALEGTAPTVRNAGLDPVSIGPGEMARAEAMDERSIELRAPGVADIGRRAWVWKDNGAAALHIKAAGCSLDGVAGGIASVQAPGLVELMVIPAVTPARAEWAWLGDGSQIFGEIYLPHASASATTISVVDTWYAAAGTTVLSDGDLMSMPDDWTLQLDAYGTHEVSFVGQFSISSASPLQVMRCTFAVNGTPQTASEIARKMNTTDIGAFGIAGTFELTYGDQVSVQLLNETAGNDFTIEYGAVQAVESI